jgi:hypothetical protein
MKKNMKLKIGAVAFGILHLLLTFIGAVFAISLAFTNSTFNEAPFIHIITMMAVILYMPLGLLNSLFLDLGAPDWIQFVILGMNSILWGFIFYKVIKFFGDKKKENKKE